jgi:hypothetical protein
VASEIPQYRAQCSQPLDAQHHVIVAQRQGVDVDVERLAADVDVLRLRRARGGYPVTVRHGHRQAGARREVDARPVRHVDVDEIV